MTTIAVTSVNSLLCHSQAPPNTFRSSERCPGAGEQSGISVEEMIWILNARVSGKTQTINLAGATAPNLKNLVL
jgi:hypothetical protein